MTGVLYAVAPIVATRINAALVAGTSEPHVLLFPDRLDSALTRPMHTWGAQFLFPSVLDRGAALLDALCQAHAFFQGNKRTAWICTAVYLATHGVRVAMNYQAATAQFVLDVVEHKYELHEIVEWLAARGA